MSDKYTILIVEDDPGFSSYLKRLLLRKDLNLITANSGRLAIQCLNENTVDLVLQDIGLPDIDGYQVMDHIRRKFPETLVIVMTGELTVESAVKALRKGAYDYLRKPFESTELLNTVDNALDRLRLEQQHEEAEKKLRDSQEKYHQLFESESDAIMVLDAETLTFDETNKTAQQLYGYTCEEFSNLVLEDISAQKDEIRKVIAKVRKGAPGSRIVPCRYFLKKDGTTFPGELSVATFTSGGRKKIIGAVRDITERHQKDEELRRTKQRLQHILASNPAVIYSCNPTGDCATTFMSANVKTELGYESREFTQNREFWIDHIHPEDVEYVKDEFSKPGAPKMVRTNINESLKEAIMLSSVTMRKNGIKIEKSLALNLPQCYADPHLIEQVVLNLITNAARAMEKSTNGNKRVEIKSSAENNTLSIQVADSGPGVPVELREKIFDPFFTTKDDGSGIGLNIAQRIVADHNGSISLGSSRWGGAEFKIELPIERRINNR